MASFFKERASVLTQGPGRAPGRAQVVGSGGALTREGDHHPHTVLAGAVGGEVAKPGGEGSCGT